jgi:hypothetical protein
MWLRQPFGELMGVEVRLWLSKLTTGKRQELLVGINPFPYNVYGSVQS